MNTVTIRLHLPPKILHPNARPHWAPKAKATKKYRRAAGLLASSTFRGTGPKWKKATVQCVFYFQHNRRRDQDNLNAWMKAGFDGLADSGLILNDSGLTHLPPRMEWDSKDPRVEITVTNQEA